MKLTISYKKSYTKITNILLIISAQERFGVVSKQKEIYRYRPKWVRNIGYRQNPISCIPNYVLFYFGIKLFYIIKGMYNTLKIEMGH